MLSTLSLITKLSLQQHELNPARVAPLYLEPSLILSVFGISLTRLHPYLYIYYIDILAQLNFYGNNTLLSRFFFFLAYKIVSC